MRGFFGVEEVEKFERGKVTLIRVSSALISCKIYNMKIYMVCQLPTSTERIFTFLLIHSSQGVRMHI